LKYGSNAPRGYAIFLTEGSEPIAARTRRQHEIVESPVFDGDKALLVLEYGEAKLLHGKAIADRGNHAKTAGAARGGNQGCRE